MEILVAHANPSVMNDVKLNLMLNLNDDDADELLLPHCDYDLDDIHLQGPSF